MSYCERDQVSRPGRSQVWISGPKSARVDEAFTIFIFIFPQNRYMNFDIVRSERSKSVVDYESEINFKP